MKTRPIIGLWIAIIASTALGEEPRPKPPELKVLEKFVGTWDCEGITKPTIWTPNETRVKTVEVNEMSLDGWFLHGSNKTSDGKTQAILMNTYDPIKKKYHIWKFTSGGGCEELTGHWDEKTSTLTITTDLHNGITSKAAFHLIDKDYREFDVTAKDGDGKVYLNIHGTVTRRK